MIEVKLKHSKVVSGVGSFTFMAGKQEFYVLLLEPPTLDESKKIFLDFKSSDVIISTHEMLSSSISNWIACTIKGYDIGEIFCVVYLSSADFELESIITKRSFDRLGLQAGMNVFACIKSTSFMLKQC